MIELFTTLSNHMLKGLMLHAQWADMFQFLNMKGFSRQQERRFEDESRAMRRMHDFAITHCNKLINDTGLKVDEIPANWFEHTRFEVDNNTRKNYTKQIFKKWHDWETETKQMYETTLKTLADNGKIADWNMVNELLRDVDYELQQLTQQILDYESMDWDMEYLLYVQPQFFGGEMPLAY